MNFFSRTLTGAGLATLSVSANAVITPIGTFAGSWSETFESFPNYVTGPMYQPEPWAVFGGNASFDSTTDRLVVYDPSLAAFGLANSGSAQVSDGIQGMGLDSGPASWALTFTADVSDFGAFWGLATFGSGGSAAVDFYDASNVLVGSTSFTYNHETSADGVLDWNGWNSDVLFRTVVVTGDFVVIDGAQANAHVVPEPATMSVLALGALAMLRRRKTK